MGKKASKRKVETAQPPGRRVVPEETPLARYKRLLAAKDAARRPSR